MHDDTYRCDRANTIRDALGSNGIQISTGGGTDLPTSLQSQFFRYRPHRRWSNSRNYGSHPIIDSCQNLQIIALHDYNLDTSYVASHVDAAKPLALNSGKRLLYEEFGATGSNKQSQIQSITNLLISVCHTPSSLSRATLTTTYMSDRGSLDVLGGRRQNNCYKLARHFDFSV